MIRRLLAVALCRAARVLIDVSVRLMPPGTTATAATAPTIPAPAPKTSVIVDPWRLPLAEVRELRMSLHGPRVVKGGSA